MAAKSSGGHGRSAISGKFVTTKYATSHPKTTVVEHKSSSKPAGKSGSKK